MAAWVDGELIYWRSSLEDLGGDGDAEAPAGVSVCCFHVNSSPSEDQFIEFRLMTALGEDLSAAAALCKQAQCCRSPFQRYAQSATLAGHETSASPKGRRPAIIDCEIEPVDGWNLENCSPQRSPAQKSVRSPQLGAHAFGRRSGRSNGQLSPFKTGSPSAGLPRGSIAFDSDQAPWDGELQLDDDVVNPIAPFFRSPRAHAHVVSIER